MFDKKLLELELDRLTYTEVKCKRASIERNIGTVLFNHVDNSVCVFWHGSSSGVLSNKQDLINLIGEYKQNYKVFVICCHPYQVINFNPELDDYILCKDCRSAIQVRLYSRYLLMMGK